MWDAKPGMRVVCIHEKIFTGANSHIIGPTKGQKYTIETVHEGVYDKCLCLKLKEIDWQRGFYTDGRPIRIAWPLGWFRPLVSNSGMQTLEAILKNPSVTIKGFEQAKVKIKEPTK